LKPKRRRIGIHFRLGPDEPGFIIGGFIADCYTGGKGAYSGIIFLPKRRHANERFSIVRFGLSQTFLSIVIV